MNSTYAFTRPATIGGMGSIRNTRNKSVGRGSVVSGYNPISPMEMNSHQLDFGTVRSPQSQIMNQ